MMGLGLAATDIQAAPAAKRAEPAATPKTAAPKPATAQTQTQAAQPRKVRVVHRERRERTNDRAGNDLGDRLNRNTLVIVSGGLESTDLAITHQLSAVLDDGDDLRILPILGKGAGQNAYDIRFLKGVDLGFVRTDTLDQLREDKRLTNVDRHITYIARLFNDELHVIAPREVTDIRQLADKKVSFDVKGSGTDYTGRSMFKGLGLDIEAVNIDQAAAFDLLKRGELAAVVSVAAKPVAVVAGFDPGERFHVLPVPFVDALADKYFPATLTAKD
jgi:uncharacterized protein